MREVIKKVIIFTVVLSFCVQLAARFLFTLDAETVLTYGWLTLVAFFPGVLLGYLWHRRAMKRIELGKEDEQ